MSDKPIYGPLEYVIIIVAVTILTSWGVTDGSLGDDRPQCAGYNTQEVESAVAVDTGGKGGDVELQAGAEI